MEWDQFKSIVAKAQSEHPDLFTYPEGIVMTDAPASEEDIELLQTALSIVLPAEYVHFLKEYGGGDFGCGAEIYSAQPAGTFYAVPGQRTARECAERRSPADNGDGFFSVSPDGCGNDYGFRVVEGTCESRIVFWDHEDWSEFLFTTPYNDIFEFIIAHLPID